MFCAAFLRKKTNLLDPNIKIGIQPSLSWFNQSLVISCLKISTNYLKYISEVFNYILDECPDDKTENVNKKFSN